MVIILERPLLDSLNPQAVLHHLLLVDLRVSLAVLLGVIDHSYLLGTVFRIIARDSAGEHFLGGPSIILRLLLLDLSLAHDQLLRFFRGDLLREYTHFLGIRIFLNLVLRVYVIQDILLPTFHLAVSVVEAPVRTCSSELFVFLFLDFEVVYAQVTDVVTTTFT